MVQEAIKIKNHLLHNFIFDIIFFMTQNNKKERKNKDNTFISTYQTHQTHLTSSQIEAFDDVCHLFQTQKRKWFNNKEKNRTNFIQSQKTMINGKYELPFSYRFFQGIKQEVQGMIKSIDSNRKNYIEDLNGKLKDQQKRIKKQSEKYKNGKLYAEALRLSDDDLKKSLFYLRGRYNRLYHLKNSINNIVNDTKTSNYSICFGGKKLLQQRHLCKNDNEIIAWKKEWYEKRNNAFLLVGSWDESFGCSNGQLDYDIDKDEFLFSLTIPTILKNKHGEKIIIHNVNIPKYCRKQIKHEVLKHKNNDTNKEAISFRFIKSKKGYRINISLNHQKQNIITSSKYGVIGLDINPDNLAVTEINQHGNLIHSFVIKMDLQNKTSEQRLAIVGDSVKKLMNYCSKTNKHLVVENLDFNKKRNDLHNNTNANYARMLSSFAYQKILSLIEIQSYKMGIAIIKVNPAYTSIFGKTHFAVEKGLSNHQAAAMVIARRFYHFKEIVKRKITIVSKGEVFTLLVPEGKQKLPTFTKWLRGECNKNKFASTVEKYVPPNRRRQVLGESGSILKAN